MTNKIRCATASFIDDLAARAVGDKVEDAAPKMDLSDTKIEKIPNEKNIYQKKTKEESIFAPHGPHSRTESHRKVEPWRGYSCELKPQKGFSVSVRFDTRDAA